MIFPPFAHPISSGTLLCCGLTDVCFLSQKTLQHCAEHHNEIAMPIIQYAHPLGNEGFESPAGLSLGIEIKDFYHLHIDKRACVGRQGGNGFIMV